MKVFVIHSDSPVLSTKHSLEISHCGVVVIYEAYNAELEDLDIRYVQALTIDPKALRKVGNVTFEHIERVEMEPKSFDDIIATDVLFNNVSFSLLAAGTFNPGMKVFNLIFNNSVFEQVQRNAIQTSSKMQSVTFSHCFWASLQKDCVRINATSFVMVNNTFKHESADPYFTVESPAITLVHRQSKVMTTSLERRVGLGDRFNQTYLNTTHLPATRNNTVKNNAGWLNMFNLTGKGQSKATKPTNCSCNWLRPNSKGIGLDSWTQSFTCPTWRMMKESVVANNDWQAKHCVVTSPSAHKQNSSNGIGFSFLHLSVVFLIHIIRLVLD